MNYLDTHVAAWLHAGEIDALPRSVRRLLDTEDVVISPMAELELQYLYELGRTKEPARVVIDHLQDEIGLRRCGLPFSVVVKTALDIDWTRDPFDRLIVAQAAARNLPLVTKDEIIRDNYGEAIWGDE